MIFETSTVFLRHHLPRPWVFTNGCFDLLHPGHVSYLKDAKALGKSLIVGLNSDTSVKAIKGSKRPINPQNDRAQMLTALEMVDAVIYFHETTPIQLIQKIQPDIYVKGGDYQKENLPESPIVESYGGVVQILSFIDGYSSTKIIQRIIKAHL